MEDTILKVENLSISFTQYVKGLERRDLTVISNLDLDVKKGEIVAIVGSSGSGKSLLAHAILGILPENATLEGSITYKGKDLTEEKKAELRGKEICLIPQSVNYIDPLMQAGRFVQLSVPNDKEEAKRRQRKVFEEYNLAKEVDSMYPFQLSGGMTRRVLVSTAAIMDSEIIIADEPTPGLDEEALNETLNLFKGLRDKGASIIIITHDIQAALKIADRIAIFYAGTTLEIANREDFEGLGERL
ncbi:MAG: ABC transporter ATP-binding protein, partial [Clostridia bacterium]|nr:ABC transporter ATP-binding protein [Clostridia bacterium]